MALQILNRAQAFVAGSDLWIIPDGGDLPLVKKMDWYLNFQLTRARRHQSQDIAPQLRTLITENAMPTFAPELSERMPLMVSSENHFPAKTIVEVPAATKLGDWVESIHDIWLKLDRPSLRVFLPDNVTPANYENHWPGGKGDPITLVPT